MRLLYVLLLFSLVYCVSGKSNLKSLTESMGQEVIEIGTPIKDPMFPELPPDIEEEPSAEVDDDDKPISTLSPSYPPTKKEITKKEITKKEVTKKEVTKKTVATTTKAAATTQTTESRKKASELDGDEDDAKVEKELADLYKDSSDKDYKDNEIAANPNSTHGENVLRNRNNFRFQPDYNSKKDVERFRTSIDEISCDKSVTSKLKIDDSKKVPGSAMRTSLNLIIYAFSAFIITC